VAQIAPVEFNGCVACGLLSSGCVACANLPPTQDSVRLGFLPIWSNFPPNFRQNRRFSAIDFLGIFRSSVTQPLELPVFGTLARRHATSSIFRFSARRTSLLKVLNVFGHTFVARDSHDVEPITFDQVLQIFADFGRFSRRFLRSSS
jgi:hypothetical protein